jgi:hypothetical protein
VSGTFFSNLFRLDEHATIKGTYATQAKGQKPIGCCASVSIAALAANATKRRKMPLVF